MAQTTLAPDIRGVTLPLIHAQMLLPNACVSDVISYGTPQTIAEAPDWVLGIINWRGWRMPLFSYAQLVGQVSEESTSDAKVVVLKAFGGIQKMPYMAMLIQGLPRLTAITANNLVTDEDQGALPDGVLYRVTVEGEPALIPDLKSIEKHLLELMVPQQRQARTALDEHW